MTVEDIVEKLFAENPDLSEDEAVKRLKEMRDPKTNKSMWKAETIRDRVSRYFRKRERMDHAAHIESPVDARGSGSKLKEEGKEIERHKPKDPFAIKPETNVEDKVDQITDKRPIADTEQFRREIVDSVSKKVLEHVSTDAKSFRDEIVSIISDLKSAMVNIITDIKKDISNLRTQGIPAYEPVIQYDDLKLKQSTIDAVQKNTEEKELKEESEYIDNLIENEEECASILRIHHKLIDLAKDAKNGVQLRLFYENDKLSYDKKPVGWFGINPKHLIAGIAIGIPIGIIIWLICTVLTAAPPPIP